MQLFLGLDGPTARRMGVYPGGAEQPLAAFVQLAAHLQRLFAAFDAGAGEDQLSHARGVGPVENIPLFGGEAWVGQVDADVD